MVAAPVAEFQLVGSGTVGQSNDLMAQADAKEGVLSPNAGGQLDNRLRVLGISGAVGEEHAVGVQSL